MKFHSLFLTALMALSISMGSCSNDDAVKAPDGDGDGQKISFSIGVAAGPAGDISRAPVGHEGGREGEKSLSNAMILIYDRPLNSIEAAGGKIVKVLYSDLATDDKSDGSSQSVDASYIDPMAYYYPQTDVVSVVKVGKVSVTKSITKTIQIESDELEIGQRYYATAICNFGNMTDTFKDMSLKDFREYAYKGKLFDEGQNIAAYTNFRMSGINEVSFIWERKTSGNFDLGSFLVQRLAARLDIDLGAVGTDFLNAGSFNDVNEKQIQLAVYTPNGSSLKISEGSVFVLDDLEIVNNVDNASTGTYLIERSTEVDNKGNYDETKKKFFDNEGWEISNGDYQTNATKNILSPSSKIYSPYYSLKGSNKLSELISSGYQYSSSTSVVGYLTENTNSNENCTFIRIKGYTNASTSPIFQAKSRAVVDVSGYNEVYGLIPIVHSSRSSTDPMNHAVVRNTIYRVRIKVVALDNQIYFRYYYSESDNPENLKVYEVKGFSDKVGDYNGGDVND